MCLYLGYNNYFRLNCLNLIYIFKENNLNIGTFEKYFNIGVMSRNLNPFSSFG